MFSSVPLREGKITCLFSSFPDEVGKKKTRFLLFFVSSFYQEENVNCVFFFRRIWLSRYREENVSYVFVRPKSNFGCSMFAWEITASMIARAMSALASC